MIYPIAEHFVSINGEGRQAGKLAVFLRFPGCNLHCSYCDTTWVNEADCPTQAMALASILAYIRDAGVAYVTVTGGEPLLQDGMAELLHALSQEDGLQVEVETNGSVYLMPYLEAAPKVSYTMDYKLPTSGMEAKMIPNNISCLRASDTLKFVCGSIEDLMRAEGLMQDFAPAGQVYLSPVFGCLSPEDMVAFMKTKRLKEVRLQLQLHKLIWPSEQRGV